MEKIKLEKSEIEKRYDYIKQIEGHINEIEMQRHLMVTRYNIEPNKVILGKAIYEMLKGDAHMICHKCVDDTIMNSVCGLPITVDYQNVYKIAVCFALENSVECFEKYIKDRF